jgi:uncharacterized membrane protein
MSSLKSKSFSVSTPVLVLTSLLYPGAVYIGRAIVPALAFVTIALALIAWRFVTLRSPSGRVWRMPFAVAAMTTVAVAMLDAPLAVKMYPATISLAATLVFGATLLHPPSMIERFARLHEPDLPPAAQSYCRRVTIIWIVWLTANTIVSTVLAIPGNDFAWAIWTGFVAYVVMGFLFGGEILVRLVLRRRAAKT